MNIAAILSGAAAHYDDKALVHFRGEDVSHDAVSGQVDRLATVLTRHGIAPGARVVILATNSPRWLVSCFAALRTGALVVPVNPALTASEVTYILGHAEPSLVIVDVELERVLPAEPRRFATLTIGDGAPGSWDEAVAAAAPSNLILDMASDDPGLMFYTSGTTGRPKGAVLSHGAEIFTAEMMGRHYGIGPTDISLVASPLSFIYPLVIDCLTTIRAGAKLVLQERFHPEHVLRAVERQRATIFMGVPTMYSMMLDWAEGQTVDTSSLRFAISAGQNLAWSVAQRFRQRFNVSVYDLWGLTEGTPITGYEPSRDMEGRPESCGRALPGCAVRIAGSDGQDLPAGEVGEVLLSGPNVFLGYYDNPSATAETLRDGVVFTGDLGRMDEDGYLYIVGRMKDLVIRGGANIYPSEVEEVIYSHPSVQDCAVIGLPDPLYGERVKAFVLPVRGARVGADAILAHCRIHLAPYKVPGEIAFVESLPIGPTGKVLKRVLREREARP